MTGQSDRDKVNTREGELRPKAPTSQSPRSTGSSRRLLQGEREGPWLQSLGLYVPQSHPILQEMKIHRLVMQIFEGTD